LSQAVIAAASTVDVVVVCGSSSVGRADHLHGLLHDLDAHVEIDGVACRPGHPQLLARHGPTWIVGLPGNPYAALVAACTIVQPLLAGLAGRALPPLARARVQGVVPGDAHHTHLVPVRWAAHQACIVDGARPGYLGAVAHADALAVVTPTSRAGSAVELVPLPGA
jgi:molybdopterin molybdotransferase